MHMDADILSADFQVETVFLQQDKSKLLYLKGIWHALSTIAKRQDCSRILIWFADYHAAPIVLLSRLLRKQSFIFIGGYDAVCYPEFAYGVYSSKFRGCLACLALRHCTHIIANHQALLSSRNTYYAPAGHADGIYHMIPGLGTPASVVHNAVAASPPAEFPATRTRQILTVGSTPRLQDFYNKGFDLLARIAARRPDLQFVWVGIRAEFLPELNREFLLDKLPNLTIHPFLAPNALHELMRNSAVYAQPSISEGMPNALMEAMLMGCVPVGSNVAGIPTVIGDFGFLVHHRNDQELEQALDQALASSLDPSEISRSILDRFSPAIRREKLLRILLR